MQFLNSMLSDGQGNTSTMRVVTLLVVLAVLIPYVVNSVRTGIAPVFTPDQLEILGIVLGAKLVQNGQENAAPRPTS